MSPCPGSNSRTARTNRSARTSCLVRLATAAVLTLAALSLNARTKPTEYEVKAVYLYNFGKFVRWPAGSNRVGSFTICVLGEDPFGKALDSAVSGEKIDGAQVNVKRLASLHDAGSCRMLFISASEANRIRAVLQAIQQDPILTVSDVPQFTERGGMIGLVVEGDRVRFKVNLTSAQEAGLQLSSELLKVAVKVIGKSGPGD